mgnify:FL=1
MFFYYTLLSFINMLYLALHTDSSSFPRSLSAKEENELIIRMQENDDEARKRLIEHNLRLVAHIIKKYHFPAGELDDLISIGTIGLIKGINTFNSDKKIRLATYASKCIENEIFMYFRSSKKKSQDIYMNDPIDTDKEGNSLTLLDIIAKEDDIADTIDIKIKAGKLGKIMENTLDEREKHIIIHRYGLNGNNEMTQNELAERLGISRSYVSRIEKKALDKLRDAYSGQR